MSEENKNTIALESEDITDKAIAKNKVNIKRRGNRGIYIHKFKKPFEYEDKKYEILKFDFNKLTGGDMISAERAMQDNEDYAVSPEYSRIYQAHIAGRAGNIGKDVLEAMPLYDFNKITNAVRYFLLDVDY